MPGEVVPLPEGLSAHRAEEEAGGERGSRGRKGTAWGSDIGEFP